MSMFTPTRYRRMQDYLLNLNLSSHCLVNGKLILILSLIFIELLHIVLKLQAYTEIMTGNTYIAIYDL